MREGTDVLKKNLNVVHSHLTFEKVTGNSYLILLFKTECLVHHVVCMKGVQYFSFYLYFNLCIP